MTDRIPWDRPPVASAHNPADTRATAGDRKQPDGDYQAMVTIHTMDGSPGPVVTLREVRAVLERAARYRRMIAEMRGEEHPVTIAGLVTAHITSNVQITITPQGWVNIGYVLDPWAAPEAIMVWWHLESDRVKVSHPRS